MHYGTEVRAGRIDEAEASAIARHSHYYTDALGWLFRAEANRYAAIQPYADPISGDGAWYTTDPKIELFAFPVVRWTPCGARIRNIWRSRERDWVDLREGHKQWASRTAHEAIEQLAERRRRMVWVLGKKIDRAREDMRIANLVLDPGREN